jgi:hypothetical protein
MFWYVAVTVYSKSSNANKPSTAEDPTLRWLEKHLDDHNVPGTLSAFYYANEFTGGGLEIDFSQSCRPMIFLPSNGTILLVRTDVLKHGVESIGTGSRAVLIQFTCRILESVARGQLPIGDQTYISAQARVDEKDSLKHACENSADRSLLDNVGIAGKAAADIVHLPKREPPPRCTRHQPPDKRSRGSPPGKVSGRSESFAFQQIAKASTLDYG